MKYYVKKYSNDCIADIISFPSEGYSEIEYNYALPQFILNGYYKFIDGEFVVDEVAKEEYKNHMINNDDLLNSIQENNEALTHRVSELQESNAQLEYDLNSLDSMTSQLLLTVSRINTEQSTE